MSNIREIILNNCRNKWLKVSRVVWFSHNALNLPDDDESYALVEQALKSMVEEGMLEVAGNIESWRESEVRLKVSNP